MLCNPHYPVHPRDTRNSESLQRVFRNEIIWAHHSFAMRCCPVLHGYCPMEAFQSYPALMHQNCAALISPSIIILLSTETQKLLFGSCGRHSTKWGLPTLSLSLRQKKIKNAEHTDTQADSKCQLSPICTYLKTTRYQWIICYAALWTSFAMRKENANLTMMLEQSKASRRWEAPTHIIWGPETSIHLWSLSYMYQ